MLADEILPALTGDLLDQLPGNGIEDIVIGIGRAETRLGLEKGDALDRLLARQIGARHEHQVALPQPQSAPVDQQVADRDLARDPRIVHAEPRHMLDNRIVPRNLALIDEHRQRGGGHRLAGRSRLKDGFGVDRRALAQLSHAPAARQRRPAVLDDRDRHADRADLLAQRLDAVADVGGRLGPGGHRKGEHQRCRQQTRGFHGRTSCMDEGPRLTRR